MSARFLFAVFAAGAAWRALVCYLTPVPSEDGVNYLWMAERFAAGDMTAALSEVFPPLPGLLTAVPVALGMDPFRAGQLVALLAGAALAPLLARALERQWPGTGRVAAYFAVFAPLPVRYAAELYSEPLFLLLAALALDLGWQHRWWVFGLISGLAAWVRPEAALLVVAFTVWAPRRAWRSWLPFGLMVIALGVWRGICGLDATAVSKLEFIWPRTVFAGGDVVDAATQFGGHLLQVPGLWLEAFGLVGVLAFVGAVRARDRRLLPCHLAVLLGVALLCAFLPRRRFLVSWFAVVVPIAVLGWRHLPLRWQTVVTWLVVASSLALGLRVTDADRAAERAVGSYLAAQRAPGERVFGDMTRVVYFAGCRPLPPRHFTVEELVAGAMAPGVGYLVLGTRRDTTPAVEAGLGSSYVAAQLPPELRAAAQARGITVLRRLQ